MGVEITPFFSICSRVCESKNNESIKFKWNGDIVIVLRNMFVSFHSFGFNISCPGLKVLNIEKW